MTDQIATRLPRSTLIAYGLPGLAFAVPTIPVFVYLPDFYAGDMGLGLAVTGFVLLALRILDVVSDPLVGILSDRYTTRFGRRKPWIAVGGIVTGAALVMLFSPPASMSGSVAYLAVWAGLLYVGWTCIAVPYQAWGAELSADYDERTTITAVREGLAVAGIVVAAALPFAIGVMGGDRRLQLTGVAWATVVVAAPLVAWMLKQVPEPERSRVRDTGIAPMIRALGQNEPFRRLLVAWFINGLANGLPAVLLPLFLRHRLEAGTTEAAGLIFLYFAAAVVVLPFWVTLSRRTTKARAWVTAMLLACAAFVLVPFIGAGDLWAFAVVCAVTGASLGADLALPPAMQADVIDVDRARSGHERAGTYFALWSMATKLALAAAVGLAFPVLGWAGLEDGAALGAVLLVALYAALPVMLKLAACALIWHHRLDRDRQGALRQAIAGEFHIPEDRT
ncbi:MAG: MFS transporter [Sphingomonadales bacterium]